MVEVVWNQSIKFTIYIYNIEPRGELGTVLAELLTLGTRNTKDSNVDFKTCSHIHKDSN